MAPWLLDDDGHPARVRRTLDVPLGHDDGGPPETASARVATIAGAQIGIWSIEVGEAFDVEAEEVALILAGSATIEIEGLAPLKIAAGDILSLEAGVATRWIVHERLTKVFITQ